MRDKSLAYLVDAFMRCLTSKLIIRTSGPLLSLSSVASTWQTCLRMEMRIVINLPLTARDVVSFIETHVLFVVVVLVVAVFFLLSNTVEW